MENEEKDGKACCSKKCCGGKGLAVLALLLVGGAGGYIAGRCASKGCALKNATAVEAPAQPAK